MVQRPLCLRAEKTEVPDAPDLSTASKEGYLTKLGRLHKVWKTRWFVLYKNELKYYKARGVSMGLSGDRVSHVVLIGVSSAV